MDEHHHGIQEEAVHYFFDQLEVFGAFGMVVMLLMGFVVYLHKGWRREKIEREKWQNRTFELLESSHQEAMDHATIERIVRALSNGDRD